MAPDRLLCLVLICVLISHTTDARWQDGQKHGSRLIVSPLGMARVVEFPVGQVTLQKATGLVLLVTILSL